MLLSIKKKGILHYEVIDQNNIRVHSMSHNTNALIASTVDCVFRKPARKIYTIHNNNDNDHYH